MPLGRDLGVLRAVKALAGIYGASQSSCHLVKGPGPVLHSLLGDGFVLCERREGEVREVKGADAAGFLEQGAGI